MIGGQRMHSSLFTVSHPAVRALLNDAFTVHSTFRSRASATASTTAPTAVSGSVFASTILFARPPAMVQSEIHPLVSTSQRNGPRLYHVPDLPLPLSCSLPLFSVPIISEIPREQFFRLFPSHCFGVIAIITSDHGARHKSHNTPYLEDIEGIPEHIYDTFELL